MIGVVESENNTNIIFIDKPSKIDMPGHGGPRAGAGRKSKQVPVPQDQPTIMSIFGNNPNPSPIDDVVVDGLIEEVPVLRDDLPQRVERYNLLENEDIDPSIETDSEDECDMLDPVSDPVSDVIDALEDELGDGPTAFWSTRDGIQQTYIQKVQDMWKNATSAGNGNIHPDIREGNFWVYPPDAVCKTSHNVPDYFMHPDIFLWDPLSMDSSLSNAHISCPECKGPTKVHGFPTTCPARRIRRISNRGPFYLMSKRGICTKPDCQISFMYSDARILAQLPFYMQMTFPAVLTSRSSADRCLVSMITSLFMAGVGPSKLHSVLKELEYRAYDVERTRYYSLCLYKRSLGKVGVWPPDCFGNFGDVRGYSNVVPSSKFIKSVF